MTMLWLLRAPRAQVWVVALGVLHDVRRVCVFIFMFIWAQDLPRRWDRGTVSVARHTSAAASGEVEALAAMTSSKSGEAVHVAITAKCRSAELSVGVAAMRLHHEPRPLHLLRKGHT